MPEAGVVQNAFNAGEIGPTLAGRGDIEAYRSGLFRCENWQVMRAGGLEKRPGTVYVAALPDETETARLVSFVFSQTTSFVLIFSGGALHFAKGDEALYFQDLVGSQASNLRIATDEFWFENHGYADGTIVELNPFSLDPPSGLATSTEYTVRLPSTLTCEQDGTAISTSGDTIDVGTSRHLKAGMGPYRITSTRTMPTGLDRDTDYYISSHASMDGNITLSTSPGSVKVDITAKGSGTLKLIPSASYTRSAFYLESAAGLPVELADEGTVNAWGINPKKTLSSGAEQLLKLDTEYTSSQIGELQFAQDKDLLYIAHDQHPLKKLTRYGDQAWYLEDVMLEDGPYLGVQRLSPHALRTDTTISLDAKEKGERTATASEAIFSPADIGKPIRFGDPDDVNAWGYGTILSVDNPTFSDIDGNDATVDITSSGAISCASHPFVTGEGPVRFKSATGVNDVGSTKLYINKSSDTVFTVHAGRDAAIAATSPVDMNTSGATINGIIVGSAWIRKVDHGFTDQERCTLSTTGTLPSHLNTTTTYYLRVLSKDYFGFATAPGVDNDALVYPTFADGWNGTGVHSILGLADAKSSYAQVQIKRECPIVAPLSEWQLSAIGADAASGYPSAVAFHEQRLVLGGTTSSPQTLYGSQIGAFENFSPDEQSTVYSTDPESGELISTSPWDRLVTDASAWTFTLQSEDLNTIYWIRSMRILLCGTQAGIFSMMASSLGESITPTSVNARRATRTGAARTTPVSLGQYLTFVESSGAILSQAEWQPATETVDTMDLFALAPHLADGYQITPGGSTSNPVPAIYVPRSDGTLLCLAFDPREKVSAWSRFVVGGTDATIEASTTLPSTRGGDAYLVVRRGMESSEAPRINWETSTLKSALTTNTAHQQAQAYDRDAVSWAASTNQILVPSHSFTNGWKVEILGVAPAGTATGTTYYVRSVDSTHVTLHSSSSDASTGASPIDITGDGASSPTSNTTISYSNQFLYAAGEKRGDDPQRGDLDPIDTDTLEIQGERWVYVDTPIKLYADSVLTFEVKTNGLARSQGFIFSTTPTVRPTKDHDAAGGLAAYPEPPFPNFHLFGGIAIGEAKGVQDYSFTPEIDEWAKVRIPIGSHFTGENFYFGLYIDNDYEVSTDIGVDVPVRTQYRNVRITRPRRFIERVAPRFAEQDAIQDAQFLDCSASAITGVRSGSTLAGTDMAETFTGFTHLADQTVSVLADGAWHRDVLVASDGSITLDYPVRKVTIGFGYRAIAQVPPPEAETGRTQASTSMVWSTPVQVMLRCNRLANISVGNDTESLIPRVMRAYADYRDTVPPLFTGIYETRIDVPAGRSNSWYFASDGPQPAQVLAAQTRIEFSDR